ncbi:hypothetical protein [Candidatus Tisiphia endosymbiont of Ceraclea dissimilis]|uniref:hypothetical protein n=1 Tax=Candidatus Tisiphia endosymbiont of Ceraclea dissimilis TaxID=3077928 RepID=UPI003CCB1A75
MPLDKTIIHQITTNSITTLDLSNTGIGDAGAKDLAEALKINKSITSIDLCYNKIGDTEAKALAEALKDNKSITTLYLHNNQIGNVGAQALAEALKVNKAITYFNLNNNKIGDAGAQALAEALKVNKAITNFYIDSTNPIGSVGVRYLAEALKINKSIANFGTSFKNIGDIVASEIKAALQINKDFPAKAKKEALVKQYIAEQEVKEYIPNIPVVKLFEVAGEDNQLNNDDQATIKQVLDLIRDGNDHLQEHGKKGILLLGNTGADKSTLAHLLNTASNNFNQLLEVIVKAIGDATHCLNVNPLNAFSENYAIVKDLVPSSINYNELKQHSEGEYFLKLELLSRLQEVLNYEQKSSISDAITTFKQAVDIFAEYAEFDNSPLQHQIQDYGYCLRQQYEYVKFFANVCGTKLPDHAKIAELITACHAKVTENLEYQVSSLKIDEEQSNPEYYHKAIKYLENYQDSPACKNLKAIAYSCLASIAEHDSANEAALAYYAKAIEANSHLPKIYENLGQLFFNKGEYAKAIDCYKVVNNEFEIKACFKAWLKQDKRNPDIMLKQAEYFESIGLFEKAKTCYQHVFSLSHDNAVKAAAYKKIGNIMVNAAAQGQDFITKAEEQDFYNYDLVNEEFTKNLLGEVVEKCDLY